MAITASRSTLGMDREVARESAASRGRASLLRKGLRQAKKEKNYEKALQFAAGLEGEGKAYGMTGSAADTSSLAQGRVASREALANQMRSQAPAVAGRTREANIAAAKAAGTFDATREKFNKANAGKKVMDEAGNIVDAPPTTPPAGGTGTTPPPAGTPPPAAGTGTTPPPAGTPPPAAGTSTKPEVKVIVPGEKRDMVQEMEKKAKTTARDRLAGALAAGRIKDPELEKKLTPAPAPAPAPPPKTPAAPAISQKPSMSLPKITLADTPKPAMPDMSGVAANMRGVANDISRAKNPTRSAEELLKENPIYLPTAAQPKKKDAVVAARAKGGPVKAGKPYLVGEEGPEIMVPAEDGKVVSNKDLKKKSRKQLRKMLSEK